MGVAQRQGKVKVWAKVEGRIKLSGMRGKGLGPSPNFFVMVGSL